jgi:hypothetical protein
MTGSAKVSVASLNVHNVDAAIFDTAADRFCRLPRVTSALMASGARELSLNPLVNHERSQELYTHLKSPCDFRDRLWTRLH